MTAGFALRDLALRLADKRSFVIGVVAAAIVLRLAQYLANPSLWLDEAMLALNLVYRTAAQLRDTLGYEQAAPLLFLLAVRKAMDVFGNGELALRLVPLLAGCAMVPVAAFVARRVLPRATFVAALVLLAVSDPLIDYSALVKPYAVDAAVAVFVLLLVLRLAAGDGGRRDFILLGAVSLLAPWLSYPSAFVLSTGFLVLLVRRSPARNLRIALLGTIAVWIASTLGLALFATRGAEVGALQGVWGRTGGFAPFPPATAGDLMWYPFTAARVMRMPGGIAVPGLGVLLALLGVIDYARRRAWSHLVLLAGPLLAALVASMLRLYPFAGRLLLFTGPMLAMLVAAGVGSLGLHGVEGRALLRGRVATALTIAVLLSTVGLESVRAAYHLARPRVREEMRAMTNTLTGRTLGSDVVYVYYAAGPTFDYYVPDPPFQVVYGSRARGDVAIYRHDVEQLRGLGRVWIVLSHVVTWGDVNEGDAILNELKAAGRLRETYPAVDGGLYLFDLSRHTSR